LNSIDEASGSCGSGEYDVPMSEKMRKMEELAGVETSTSSNVEEAHNIQSGKRDKNEVGGVGVLLRRADQTHVRVNRHAGLS
jgi:hypothetical protein